MVHLGGLGIKVSFSGFGVGWGVVLLVSGCSHFGFAWVVCRWLELLELVRNLI